MRRSILLLILAAAAHAADWPQWRGPTRDGVAVGVPDPLPAEFQARWSVEVGLGHSSPVVAGGRVVVFTRRDDRETLLCLDAKDGKVVWEQAHDAPYGTPFFARAHGKGPFATPAIAAGRVYSFGITGILSCHELASGELVWRKELDKAYKKGHPTWGAANSPLVDGGRCFLVIGTKKKGALAAFDAVTGNALWVQPADGAAYGSPVLASPGGRPQVMALMQAGIVSADPAKGALFWKIPFETSYEQNVLTPLVHGDTVIISGYHLATVATRIAEKGGNWTVERAWINDSAPMYMSTPVIAGKHLYGLISSGRGTLVCLSLESGKFAWKSPGKVGEYASLVVAGDRILALTTEGELLTVAADPASYRETGRVKLTDRPVWAHMAVTGDALYVKDETHLTCFALSGN
jgi:outer membrane protein assembly factor BamB